MVGERNGELVPAGGGDNIPLIRNKLSIGRRESCDICLRFPNISGLHCELSYQDGYWLVRDLGSTNGVKVNGIKVKLKALKDGDELAIANRAYTIKYTMKAGQHALEEILEDEDDMMAQSLLEKAGLAKPKQEEPKRTPPARWLQSEQEREEEDF
jgi:pSer/pThr/pTyr-binding forkhead associated (FHA) protein